MSTKTAFYKWFPEIGQAYLKGLACPAMGLDLIQRVAESLLRKWRLEALAGVAQWIERGPVNQRIAGLIPSQGTCLGCRPGP